jgi:hypothetical protein
MNNTHQITQNTSDLIVVAYPSAARAEDVHQRLRYSNFFISTAMAVKHPDGHVRLNLILNVTSAGAFSRTIWGTLASPKWRFGIRRFGLREVFHDQGITTDVSERRREKPLVIKALLCPEGTECDGRFFLPKRSDRR